MEINKFSDIIGVVATEDIVEGRMVLLTTHSETYDFGSREDLMGVKLPDTSAEAAQAKYVASFALDNRSLPIYQPTPSFEWALRTGGWDQAKNVPFNSKIYLTHPSDLLGETIPSGEVALAFAGGVYTVYSGSFVTNASLAPGAYLVVANTADDSAADAGKLKYSASATGAVAIVENYDSTNVKLRFRTLVP